jgi:hypothetical protein
MLSIMVYGAVTELVASRTKEIFQRGKHGAGHICRNN